MKSKTVRPSRLVDYTTQTRTSAVTDETARVTIGYSDKSANPFPTVTLNMINFVNIILRIKLFITRGTAPSYVVSANYCQSRLDE